MRKTSKTVTVEVAPVRYKGPHDTDATMFRVAADKLEADMDIGGSNLRAAIASLLYRTADALEDLPPEPLPQTWDIGDEDPGVRAQIVRTTDLTDGDGDPFQFSRTPDNEWKGYVHGGKVYYSWAELVRRYGPIVNATPGGGPVRIRDVLAEHQYQEWNYGDGYTEPQEWGSGCTCNVVYDQYIQHPCSDDCSCRTADPVNVPEAHLQHVLAMLIRARLLRSDNTLQLRPLVKPDGALVEPWMRAVAAAIPDGAEVITSVPRQWGGTPIRTDERLGVVSDVPLDPADDRPF